MSVLWRKLARDLWGSRLALSGLLLIQAIGVGSFLAFHGCHRTLATACERYYREHRLADLVVDLRRAPRSGLEGVRRLPGVRRVRGRVKLGMQVEVPGDPYPIPGVAFSLPAPRRPVLCDVDLKQGSWFSRPDAPEVLLNEQFARAHGLGPGSRIHAVMNDVRRELLVVGTAADPENVYVLPPGGGLAPDPARYGLMYAPERFLEEAADLSGAYNQLVATATHQRPEDLEAVLDRIEDRLEDHGVAARTAMAKTASVQILSDELTQLEVNAWVFPGIFLGVGVLVLNLLLQRLVAQQRGVIGTLRAVGYTRGAVVGHFCAFGGLVGLLAALAGTLLGDAMQGGMLTMYRQFFSIPGLRFERAPEIFAMGFAVAVGSGVMGALRGAVAAARLEPAEAMRPAPPERGGSIWLERWPALWGPLSFRSKLALRTVFRNPGRSAVGAVASFFGTAILVSTMCLLDSFDYVMDHAFVRSVHQDLTMTLREPADLQARREVNLLPGVRVTEAQLLVVADLRAGHRRERAAVTGLPRPPRLATPLDGEGNVVVPPREGLVLSDKLARLLGVGPGDVVSLRPLTGERRRVSAPVVRTAETFMGLGAWADRGYLSRLVGEEDVANQLASALVPGASPRAYLAAARERPRVVEVTERRRALVKMEEITGMQLASLGILSLLAGSIAFGSVLNTALVSLSERRREVATLRVVGYTPWQVGTVFSLESGLVNAVGIALGTLGGVGLVYLVATAYDTELMRFPVVLEAWRVLASAAVMAGFVLAAQAVILVLMTRFDWLEALKVKE